MPATATARAAAARWAAPHWFDDAATMLESVEVEGVVVCVDPPSYAELVTLCVRRGLPVFCEKPGAADATQAAALAALSEETGVPIVVGYMKRFAPAYRRAREMVLAREFGRPTLATFTFAMGQGWDADLRTYMLENPVHHLDLARYLVSELHDLQAHVTEIEGFGQAVAAIATSSLGAVCTFNLCTTASWTQRNESAEIYGEGHAVLVENVDTCTYRPAEPPAQVWRPNYTVPRPENAGPTVAGFLPELQHFRAVALDGEANLSDMTSAAATLALAERLCELAGV